LELENLSRIRTWAPIFRFPFFYLILFNYNNMEQKTRPRCSFTQREEENAITRCSNSRKEDDNGITCASCHGWFCDEHEKSVCCTSDYICMWCCVQNKDLYLFSKKRRKEEDKEEESSDDSSNDDDVYAPPKVIKEDPPLWQQADQLWTTAASTLVKYKGLQAAALPEGSRLVQAIPRLYEDGEKKYRAGCDMIKQLSPEDLDKFWSAQERNKGASKFEELITKKEYSIRQQQQQSIMTSEEKK
jgi:hypothetical protein